MATNNPESDKDTVPRGSARLGTDTNGHVHYYAPAVKDRRVFIADSNRTVLETHDLKALAAEGVLDADTPRAWVDQFNESCAGFETVKLGQPLNAQLAAGFDRELPR